MTGVSGPAVQRPAILASLPSSGSTWVARSMAEGSDHRYAYEFFCPIVNLKYAAKLERVLGDTLYGSVDRLCAEPIAADELRELLRETWDLEDYTFTKELYIGWHLDAFLACGFEIVVMRRPFRLTFPPSRRRVIRWYDAFYWSLVRNNRIEPEHAKRGPTVRAAVAHYHFNKRLRTEAERLGLGIMRYEVLTSPDRDWAYEELKALPSSFDRDAVFEAMNRSREPVDRDSSFMAHWEEAIDVYTKLEERFGPC